MVPILAFYDHLGDMAISGSIFRRGVALSRFGADVQKLHQKFGPYMGPPLVALAPNSELIKALGGGATQLVPITPCNFRSASALIGNKRFFQFGSFLMVLIAVC